MTAISELAVAYGFASVDPLKISINSLVFILSAVRGSAGNVAP